MKPAPFEYHRPASLAETFDLLDRYGDDGRILAGGQRLVPTLNMRLVTPRAVIDINRLPDLDAIRATAEGLEIGALVRHEVLERSPLVTEHASLIAAAIPHVGHAAIRARGTVGGSLGLADPAAELPACAVALEATIRVTSRRGGRDIAAADFFRGIYTTALEPGEVVTAIAVPRAAAGWLGVRGAGAPSRRLRARGPGCGSAPRARDGGRGAARVLRHHATPIPRQPVRAALAHRGDTPGASAASASTTGGSGDCVHAMPRPKMAPSRADHRIGRVGQQGSYTAARAASPLLYGSAEFTLCVVNAVSCLALVNGQDLGFAAEVHRTRAMLSLRAGGGERGAAEADLRRALQIARQQEAPSLQLRAARDLARVLAERGERSQAAVLLAPIYASFTEGFDTPDLKEAKALLDELAAV